MASRMVNTTTPTPSLNRLSPAIFACSVFGTSTVLRMPSTATGSVGEISAPNTRHQAKGSGMLSQERISQVPVPTIAVEISTPSVAMVPIAQRREASASRSTCSAPANRSRLSIPFIRVSGRSICPSTAWAVSRNLSAGTAASTAIVPSAANSAMMTRPMVCGNFSQRWLT